MLWWAWYPHGSEGAVPGGLWWDPEPHMSLFLGPFEKDQLSVQLRIAVAAWAGFHQGRFPPPSHLTAPRECCVQRRGATALAWELSDRSENLKKKKKQKKKRKAREGTGKLNSDCVFWCYQGIIVIFLDVIMALWLQFFFKKSIF